MTVSAILGAIVGVAIDDSSRGAAIGAGVGTVAGAAVRAEGQHQALLQQARAYRRAFAACLEGHNYVVR